MSKFAGLELAVEKPARMQLVHPVTRQALKDGDGKDAFIDLFSSDSDVARDHARAVARKRLAARGRGKLTVEEIEADTVESLVVLTAAWHLVDLTGKVIGVPCTPENARDLYAAPALAWVRDQVDEFAADRGNFSKA